MSSRRQRSIPLGGRYRQVSLYYFLPLVFCQNWHLGAYVLFSGCISVCYLPKLSFCPGWPIFCLYVCLLLAKNTEQLWQVHFRQLELEVKSPYWHDHFASQPREIYINFNSSLWQYIKYISRPSDRVLWATITYIQFQLASFPGMSTFRCELLLSNYHLKPNWYSCQPYPVCNYWKYLFGLRMVGFVRGVCRELLECHKVLHVCPSAMP